MKFKHLIFCFLITNLLSSSAIAIAEDEAQMEANIKKAGIETLEREFNFKYENDAQTDAFIVGLVKNYYTNLRQCNPGTYKYAVPFVGLLVATSTIVGFSNDKCVVNITLGEASSAPQICEFQKSSLSVFTDAEAESVLKPQNYNGSNPTPLQKVLVEECKY